MNSGILNGLQVKDAIRTMKEYIEENGLGRVKVNYRLRDAIFSRQRYWGEPFPIYYKDGMPYLIPYDRMPLCLPEVENFKPTADGQPPLGNAKVWAWDEKRQLIVENELIDNKTVFPLELNTMPGFAGSSAYYLRYMDPRNDNELVSREANDYWQQVDLYIGGTEHATGHLIYSRFWNKFLFDLGYVCKDEPFAKLINQGMIQGRSNFVYRFIGEGATGNLFISANLIDNPEYKGKVQPVHVDINIVKNDILDIDAFRNWMPEYKNAEFVYADGTTDIDNPYPGTPAEKQYICGNTVEKMSKSMFNVVNPDDVVENYGADTLRLYEMFLGPLEQSKPWDTNGIDGVHRFLKRFWAMFDNLSDGQPTADELRSLHKTIKKVTYDIEHFSFNTSIPAFMICQNELSQLKCNKRAILEPLVVILAPFAPHIAEELYHHLGHETTVCDAPWPVYDDKLIEESKVKYPVSFNGKTRFFLELDKALGKDDIEQIVMQDPQTAKYTNGATPKKVIVVPGQIVNVVL